MCAEYLQIVGGLPVIFRGAFVCVEYLQIVGVRLKGACVQNIFRMLGCVCVKVCVCRVSSDCWGATGTKQRLRVLYEFRVSSDCLGVSV